MVLIKWLVVQVEAVFVAERRAIGVAGGSAGGRAGAAAVDWPRRPPALPARHCRCEWIRMCYYWPVSTRLL